MKTGPDKTPSVRGQEEAPCPGPRCATGPPAARVPPGTGLCTSCRTRLAEALVHLPALYEKCGERHFGARPPAWERPPAPRRRPADTLHASAADIRRAVLGVLASWAGLTAQETGTRPPRRSVDELCAFLHRHLGLLARHPAAAEFAAEVADLRVRAERVAGPGQARQAAVGPCVETGCGGWLTARAARDRQRPARISCDADPAHSWSGTEWLSPGRRTNTTAGAPPARGPRWLSQPEVTALWGVPRGSVYRLASEQRWERRRVGGRTYYAAEDVRRAMAHTGD